MTGCCAKVEVFGKRGFQGFTGIQGLIGITGAQGVIGLDGQPGVQGPVGIGLLGLQGPIGLDGLRGFQGDVGANGNDGLQGPIGLTGVGVQGPAGDVGQIGPQGLIGLTGIGLQGPIGLTGLQGNVGLDGLQGPIGIGLQGPIGLTGVQGFAGLNGVQGFTGFQGPIGLIGFQGPEGLVGFQGPEGPAAAGAIIPFASGTNLVTSLATGTPPTLLTAAISSFGTGTTLPNTGAIITVPASPGSFNLAFTVPRNGTITSVFGQITFAATLTLGVGQVVNGRMILYINTFANPGTTLFNALPTTAAIFIIASSAVPGDVIAVTNNSVLQAVNAGDRLMLAVELTSTSGLAGTVNIDIFINGGITIL